jgi:hypothetical protein
MQRDTLSRDEMAVYDAIVAAGDLGITLGDLVKRFGPGGKLPGILAGFLRSFIVEREGMRLYASENI